MGWVYVLESDCWGKIYKIGRTNCLSQRIYTLKIQLPAPVKVVATMPTCADEMLERHLHKTYEPHRLNGEWFALYPECVEYLRELADHLRLKAHGGYEMEWMDFWMSLPNSMNGSGILNEEEV